MNILFTCAGRRNYLINYFKEALGDDGKVLASDMQDSAPAMVDADEAFIVPAIYEDGYLDAIKKIVAEQKVDAVISLNDLELPILSAGKDEIEQLGARVIVSDERVIRIAFDKWETALFVESIGLRSPRTYIDLEEAKKALASGELKFPLVIKPRWGSASIGIDFPEDMEELELAYKLLTIRLTRSILAEASKEDLSHAIMIQEKIDGDEYGMDVLNNFDGEYMGTFARKKLSMRSGETDKAISVIDPKIEEIGKTIGQNLKHIGNLDCDIFEEKGEYYILELNPRFGGGYPFSHEAGINTAAIYIDWLKGKKGISAHSHYAEGLMFSKCDRLIKVN
ncbi:MAG: ATP-grasp domain-containing protein [Chitinophagaceae bacterium]|nr:ATP-grasp domain-containing protein [Chitinophagaceae bacterium]